MLSGATRSKEHQREFLTSDRGLKREEEKEGQEEERVLPAALTQPGEYLDRFWDEDRMVEEKRKKTVVGPETQVTAPQVAEQAEKSRRRLLESHKKGGSCRGRVQRGTLGAPGAFLGPFLGLSGQHRSPGWLLVWSDAAAGGGMWLLWCVLVPALQRWA